MCGACASWPARLAVGLWLGAIVVFASAAAFGQESSRQPRLGFEGSLVKLSPRTVPAPDDTPNMGMRVDSVQRGGSAWRMGLERGDIVISIDSMRFTSREGYLHALRAAGQRPSIILVDVRTGQLKRRTCNLPHRELSEADREPKAPDTYLMAIDLAEDMRGR